ncbi:MAG: hypothetical protein ACUVR0_06410 [Candidatus Aminicenantales bacterium]
MKKRELSLIIFCGLSLFLLPGLHGQQNIIEAVFSPLAVTLDGNQQDWTDASLTNYKNADVDYAFRHDGQNLYILFIFNEPKFLSTIEATGMTIYFSPAGKKNKDFGLKFIRKNVSGEELIALMEKQGTPPTEEQKAQLLAKPQARYLFYETDIVSKKGEAIAPHDQQEVQPPAFRAGRSGKRVVYEFRVPLASPSTYSAGIGYQPGQALRVGFEWGGMTPEMRKAMMARMAAEGTTARASDSSFEQTIRGGEEGEGMMMGGGPSPRLGSNPKKYSFWVDLKLGVNQQ